LLTQSKIECLWWYFLLMHPIKFENFLVPWICYFGHKPFNWFLIFLVLWWYWIYFSSWPALHWNDR
jgi:hypothetical protein